MHPAARDPEDGRGGEETAVNQPMESQGRRAAPGICPGKAFSSTLDTLSGGGDKRREVADRTTSLPCSDVALTSGDGK